MLCRPLWVGLVSLLTACQIAKCLYRVAASKRRFLKFKKISDKHLCKITKCGRDYKVRQRRITNYDRFWVTKSNKNFKKWITKCKGLQSVTSLDYKLQRDYKARRIQLSDTAHMTRIFFKIYWTLAKWLFNCFF